MYLAVTIEHPSPDYVEARGGYALLSHLRGAPARVEHRREAIERALSAFDRAEHGVQSDAEIGGLGLLVLQRALLAAEDLGGLLHAFAGPDPWQRLRDAKIPDLDTAFRRASDDAEGTVTDTFRLATNEQINASHPREDERAVMQELRARALERWSQMLWRASLLWSVHRNVAKATMHGFPIVAGAHIEGPPPAGELAEGIRSPGVRYAVAVTSKVSGTHVTTDRTVIPLARDDVRGYHRLGRAAARLTGELCEHQALTIMRRHSATVPFRSVRFMDAHSQAIAERILAGREAST